GEAYLSMNENQKAEEALRVFLGKRPDLLPVRMNLSHALEQQGRYEDAEKEVAQVAQRSSAYSGLTERRARLLLRQGHYDEAEALYLKAAAEPGASQSLRLDAVSYNLKSHPKDAETILFSVIKEDPRSVRAHTLFALLRLGQQEV